MSFGSGGGGVTFLNSKDIKEGMKGKITAAAYLDTDSGLTYADGPKKGQAKDIWRLPLNIEGMGDVLWAPGKFAAKDLVLALGNPEGWKFPIAGEFHERKWETTKQRGMSWRFEVNGSRVDAPKATSQPSGPASAASATQSAGKSGSSNSAGETVLDCPICGTKILGKTPELANKAMKTHISKEH